MILVSRGIKCKLKRNEDTINRPEYLATHSLQITLPENLISYEAHLLQYLPYRQALAFIVGLDANGSNDTISTNG